ncbi:MAG: hypothetical protein HY060_26045 [Proteobacteria bacterium]|nr:hypothetical protein [Pseudomonadota bacterium]
MARRPNYRMERNQRSQAKQAKREAKLRAQEEITAQRKAAAEAADNGKVEEKEPGA